MGGVVRSAEERVDQGEEEGEDGGEEERVCNW